MPNGPARRDLQALEPAGRRYPRNPADLHFGLSAATWAVIHPGMSPDAPSHADLSRILGRTRVIACVGISPNPIRPSNYVGRYLSLKGYRVIPVNPAHAGETLFGETVVADITEAPEETDMVDIFRRSEHVPEIVAAAIGSLPNLRTVWMQIGVRSEEAAAMARAHGIDVVQDMCPKMEHQRLWGDLRTAGIGTGVLSSRL
jgi:predicted CoA-binding protein